MINPKTTQTMTNERGRNEHIICEEILDTQTMKTLIEKLQYKVDFFRERSKENLKQAVFLQNTYGKNVCDHEGLLNRGLCKGYADAYDLAAKWIQEIIDYELQDNEK